MAAEERDDAAFASTSRIRYSDDGSRREGHLMALLPLSRRDADSGERILQEFRVYVELSAFLAYRHVQRRSGAVLPELPERLKFCDFSWTYRHHDTQFSPLQAAREVLSYELPQLNNNNQHNKDDDPAWYHVPPAEGESDPDEVVNVTSSEFNDYWMLSQQQQQQQVEVDGDSSQNYTGHTTPLQNQTNSDNSTYYQKNNAAITQPPRNEYWTVWEAPSAINTSTGSPTTAPALSELPSPSTAINDYWIIPATTNTTGVPAENVIQVVSTPPSPTSEPTSVPTSAASQTTRPPSTSKPSPPPTQQPSVNLGDKEWADPPDLSSTSTNVPPPRTPPPRDTEAPLRTAVPQKTQMPWSGYTDPRDHYQQHPPGSERQRRHLQQSTAEQQQKPFAVLGAARSVTSQAVGILGSAFDLPQISSSSTASILDDIPTFARTVPTNEGDAHATIVYLKQQLHVTHVGVLFINDSWGRRYEQDLQNYAKQYGITVKSVPYTFDSQEGLDKAMAQLQQLNLRYFVGIINPSAWKPVVQKAYNVGLMGQPDNTWFIADLVELVGDGFTLDRETESDIALALHGTGVVFLQVTPHPAFDQALAAVANDPELQQEFIASHSDPQLLENFTFSPSPGMSLFQYLTYDAVVALGITACETPGLFTGKEFYDQLVQVDFEGVSGRVNLHATTGTRLGDSLRYQIVNMMLEDFLPSTATTTTDPSNIRFSSEVSSLIELSPQNNYVNGTGPLVHSVKPFVYFDNTTTPPAALPTLEVNMNLIPKGILYFGLTLAMLVMLLSLAIVVWVLRNQTKYVIRCSQPFFLCQLCLGTFILASTIIPMGWQEPRPGLDAACMSTPWLFCTGFTVAISALFSKANRINKLMGTGVGFRRCQIKPRDVMKPFFILMTINIVLLTAWSASPWRISWHRIVVSNNVDQFGRDVESYGVCRADGKWHFLFSVPLVTVNVIILGMATYQSYCARALPSELSETAYLAISMISLTETFWLGITIVFTVISNPTAFYLVSSLLICVGCMAILGPMFGPKWLQRNMKEPRGRMSTSIIVRRRTGVSGLCESSALNLPTPNGASVSHWASNSGSSNGSRTKSSDNLATGTYHGSRRSEEISPFGSSQPLVRAATDHARNQGRSASTCATLHTHEEEEKSSSDDSSSFG